MDWLQRAKEACDSAGYQVSDQPTSPEQLAIAAALIAIAEELAELNSKLGYIQGAFTEDDWGAMRVRTTTA